MTRNDKLKRKRSLGIRKNQGRIYLRLIKMNKFIQFRYSSRTLSFLETTTQILSIKHQESLMSVRYLVMKKLFHIHKKIMTRCNIGPGNSVKESLSMNMISARTQDQSKGFKISSRSLKADSTEWMAVKTAQCLCKISLTRSRIQWREAA